MLLKHYNQNSKLWTVTHEDTQLPLKFADTEAEVDQYLASVAALKADAGLLGDMLQSLMINQPFAALKAVGTEGDFLVVEGPLVRFGDKKIGDLRGDFFKADTEYALDWFDRRPVLFNHGLDSAMSTTKIGDIISIEQRDEELWARAHLDMRKRYMSKVKQWVEQGLMGWSSGTLAHLLKSTNGQIERWPIVEGSLTLTPMDPRNLGSIISVKSLLDILTDSALQLTTTSQETDTQVASGEDGGKPAAAVKTDLTTDDECVADKDTNKMNINDMIAKFVGEVASSLAKKYSPEEQAALVETISKALSLKTEEGQTEAQLADATIADQAASANIVAEVVKAMNDLDNVKASQDNPLAGAAIKGMVGAALKGAVPKPKSGAAVNLKGFQPGSMVNLKAKVHSKYSNLDGEDMAYMKSFLDGMHRAKFGQPYQPEEDFWVELADRFDSDQVEGLPPQAMKAFQAIKSDELDNTTATAAGAEWVPELWLNQIWARTRMNNVVAPLFQTIQMPSQTYNLPIESTDPTVYKVLETQDENTLALDISTSPIPDSVVATGKVQLIADKLALRVGYSSEMEEESIIPFASQARAQGQRAIMDAIDNVFLNGDSATSGNINLDGGTPAATAKYMVAFPGILKLPIVTNTALRLDASGAAPTLAHLRAIRQLLPNHYAARIPDLAYICDFSTYMKLLGIPEILTVDKYGPRATVMTGEVGKIDGIQVFVTNEMALADADGKVTSGGNVVNRGRLLLVHRPSFYAGYRRQVTVNVEYLSFFDAYQMTATVRPAFTRRDTTCASLLYNIGVG